MNVLSTLAKAAYDLPLTRLDWRGKMDTSKQLLIRDERVTINYRLRENGIMAGDGAIE